MNRKKTFLYLGGAALLILLFIVISRNKKVKRVNKGEVEVKALDRSVSMR